MRVAKRSDVLVVGGGPVGLAAAIECGRLGLEVLLVERRDGRVTVPRMNLVNARSMEFCRRWGVAREVVAAGWPAGLPPDVVYATSLSGFEVARFHYPAAAARPADPATPEGGCRCSQLTFDPILLARAGRDPRIELRHRTELLAFEDDGHAVHARLRGPEGEWRVEAGHLLACDGAESVIRQALGIRMSGAGRLSSNLNLLFASPDLHLGHGAGCPAMTWLVGPDGVWGNLVSVDGRGLWRLSCGWPADGPPPDETEARALIRRAAGFDATIGLRAVFAWIRREEVADRFRAGRVLLAGDAAHVMSPTGGLGMNTGLGDAVGAAWVVAARTRGWGGEALLDAYDVERRGVAAANVGAATANFRRMRAVPGGPAIADPTPEGARQRAAAAEAVYTTGHRREYECDDLVLGYDYAGSPVLVPDGTPPEDPARQSARPGRRAPHAWIAPGRSTLDLYGDGFVLLSLGGTGDAEALVQGFARLRAPLAVVRLDDPDLAALHGAPLVLVRPDGHVAWRGTAAGEEVAARACGRASLAPAGHQQEETTCA